MNAPRITVVTPSLNQGRFLEETIMSVIGQQYPQLEYIVMDGGSTDGSVEIIRKYERHLAYWVSEQDDGQASVINKAFRRATGDILAWLNSDDVYLPGALAYIAGRLDPTRAQVLFGNCVHVIETQRRAFGSDVRREHPKTNLLLTDYIIQPGAFWTRKAWVETGPLDESLEFGLDWEWFIRARKGGVTFLPEDKYLANYRFHDAHKTGTGGERRLKELASIYGRHAGVRYEQLFLRCCARRSAIAWMRKWLRRARLYRFEVPIIKMAFPMLFRRFRQGEVRDIINMLQA